MTKSRSRMITGAMAAATALVLSACGGGGGDDGAGVFADCDAAPNTCNGAPAAALQQGGQIAFAIEKDIANWNINSAEGGVFETGLVIDTFLPKTFWTNPDLQFALNTDLLVSAEQVNSNPQTIVYKIQPNATWGDGTPITADDFIYNWKTQNGRDCPDCAAAISAGYENIASIVGSDGGKTVTLTFGTPYTDWQGLFNGSSALYPAHIAAQQGDLNTPQGLAAAFTYFGQTAPTYTGGPYQLQNFQPNVAATMVPNPRWYGKTKPKLDRLVFRIITEASQEPPALANNEVQVLYPQPQVDLVQQIRNIPDVSSYTTEGLEWEHFDFNLRNPFLANEALRDAMFTAVNRRDIIDKTVGQFAEVAPYNSRVFFPQQQGYEDTVTETGHGSGNLQAARQILTDAGYRIQGDQLLTPDGRPVPPMRIRYATGNQIRQSQVELFAQYVRPLGITLEIQTTDDLGSTLSSGDYDIACFAWSGSPTTFTNAQQIFLSTSESNFGQYRNPQVDDLLNRAAGSTDVNQAGDLLNQADRIVGEDAYVLPLYQKPRIIALYGNVANVRNNASVDGPPYNAEEWGIRTE